MHTNNIVPVKLLYHSPIINKSNESCFNMTESMTRIYYNRKLKLLIIKLAHFLLSTALFFFAWVQFRYQGSLPADDIGYRYNYFITIAYAVILLFFYKTYNAFLLGYWRVRSLVFAQLLSQLFSLIAIYFLVSIAWNHFDNPTVFLLLIVIQFFLILAGLCLATGSTIILFRQGAHC